MKRGRDHETIEMVNGLMLLSKVGGGSDSDTDSDSEITYAKKSESYSGRVFECKTCNRQFPSFQALGGHRASHKKPKMSESDDQGHGQSPPKPKTHKCPICGLEFAIGQALGGHMRRHRQAAAEDNTAHHVVSGGEHHAPLLPVLKKSNSCKRVCADLDLDLHLAPPGTYYDLKLRLKSPLIFNCFSH